MKQSNDFIPTVAEGSIKQSVYLLPQRASSIIPEVERFFGLEENASLLPTRKREIVQVRQIVCWLETKQNLAKDGKQKYRKTGELFPQANNKPMDHATVKHGVNVIDNLMYIYPDFRRKMYKLQKQLFSNVPFFITKKQLDERH